jgi:hypothetical protein
MKLYNLFEEVILEGNNHQIISEGVSDNEIIKAIDGKYNVNIQYKDFENQPPSNRYIQIYTLGVLSNGLKAIRAYQISGGSKTKANGEWKIFRLDRIVGLYPTNMKFSKPISDYSPEIGKYNPNGDKKGNFIKGQRVNTFTNIIKQVNFKTSFFNKIANTVRNFRFENEEPTNNNLV